MDKKQKAVIGILIGVAALFLTVLVAALCIALLPSDSAPEIEVTGPDPATVIRSPAITGEYTFGEVPKDRRENKELIATLLADGAPIAYDRGENMYYLSVSDASIGTLTGISFGVKAAEEDIELSLVFEDAIDQHSYFKPENNKLYRLIAYDDLEYQTASITITTMPFLTIETADGSAIGRSDVQCLLTLRDGNWKEHGSAPVTVANAWLHVRGATSASFPKKAYRINLRERDYTTQKDLSLLGLRSDDDYVLDAMYIDHTRMHNKIASEIWNEMNPANNAADGEYVEVILNGQYVGVYDLLEVIDRKQLGLDEEYGLLIKSVGWDGTFFNKYDGFPESTTWMNFEVKYPKENIDANSWGMFFDLLAATADAAENPDGFLAVTDYFDHQNLTDYWIWLTTFSLRDNRGKNLFWSTTDISAAGQKYIITPWDCDIGFGYRYGNNEFSVLSLPCYRDEYQNDYIDDFTLLKQYIDMDVNGAKETIRTRWKTLSADGGILSLQSVLARFDTYRSYLEETGAWDREMKKWPTGMVEDPDEEFEYMTEWMINRYEWMDQRVAEVTGTGEEANEE